MKINHLKEVIELMRENIFSVLDCVEELNDELFSEFFEDITSDKPQIDRSYYMHTKEFCDKYLFCTYRFIKNTIENSDSYNKDKFYSVNIGEKNKIIYIDPVYFLKYMEENMDKYPRVYNSFHRMIKVNEALRELAKKAGILK